MRKKKKSSGLEQIGQEIKKEYKFLRRLKEKNENHLLFAAFVVVVTSIVVVNTLFIINYYSVTHQASNQVATPNKLLTTLQKAETDAYQIKVANVTVTDKEDKAFALPADQILLVMDVAITNTSPEIQQLIPATQFYVRDRDGGIYQPHVSSHLTAPLAFAKLNPHKTVTGQLSFGIPKILAHPLLYVDLGWSDNAPLVIDVMR